jgi:hypothetical protein
MYNWKSTIFVGIKKTSRDRQFCEHGSLKSACDSIKLENPILQAQFRIAEQTVHRQLQRSSNRSAIGCLTPLLVPIIYILESVLSVISCGEAAVAFVRQCQCTAVHWVASMTGEASSERSAGAPRCRWNNFGGRQLETLRCAKCTVPPLVRFAIFMRE